MCAVGLPEVKFIDVVKRAPIDICAIPVQRYKLVSNKHTHFCFTILVRTLHRLPMILYQVNDIFYHLTLNLPITETCKTLDLNKNMFLANL